MTKDTGRRARAEERALFGGAGIATFSEMLVIGLGVTFMALPLITFVPAFAAGTRHLHAHLDHEPDSLQKLLVRSMQAIRSGWWFGTASAVVLGLLILNVIGASRGLLPGGMPLATVSGALTVVIGVAVLRTAGLWRPGARWSDLWRAGRNVTVDDPIGSLFVIVGIGVSIAVVWMLPPLIVIAPGLTVMSVVAAERRRVSAAKRKL